MAGEDRKRQYRKMGKWWYLWFAVSGILLLMMLYYFYAFPYMGLGPEQPVSFSHRVHAGVKQINCRFCHPFAERSEVPGIPVMEKCFFCHDHIIPMHPQIVKEKEHYVSGNPVPWMRIYFLPDFVKFTHQPHVRWAKVACQYCHGPVEVEDRLRTHYFKMGFCINCHKEHGAQLDCYLACHH